MKIPIRNLYYLFLYAWDRFPGGALTSAGLDDSPDLPNLLARLLSSGTKRLVRRGLDRDYRAFTEELVSPRGRLRLDRMAKETTKLRGTVVCDIDELSHDVLHNQILKSTLSSLGRSPEVEKATRHELRALASRFPDVLDIRVSGGLFRRIAVSRNNREYAFLMRICEFLFWSLMPDQNGAEVRFQRILEDETKMSSVFEKFLRSFYQIHRPEYRVRAEAPAWHVSDATEADLALLPRMITDITLRGRDRTIIVDAKFYRAALAPSPFGERVRSQHLYQLITYLQHERARRDGGTVVGMLLYPQVGRQLRLQYRLLGIPTIVATVDLGQDWQSVEAELHQLIDICGEYRQPIVDGREQVL